MKFIQLITFLITISVYSQNDKYWYAFTVEDNRNTLSLSLGYQDHLGTIKIEPIYVAPYTQNKRFEKVVALTEYSKEKLKYYYLNKQGRKFGIDSLYTFDFTHDTEQEGFIRFSVGKYLDSIGLFNSDGKVVIEPKYNELSKVTNGLVIAKIGAKQKHEPNHIGCDHWTFEGGTDMVLDTMGTVLINNFKEDGLFLNLYTLKISTVENKEKFRHNFRGENAKYYSFISSKEEFDFFVNEDFLKNSTKENLSDYLFINLKPTTIIENKKLVKELSKVVKLFNNNSFESNFSIPFYIDSDNKQVLKSIEQYLNNADELNFHKYPMFEISCTDNSNKTTGWISFIRTENGYKIFEYNLQKAHKNAVQVEKIKSLAY